jgi:hypothetical protein
VRGQSLPTKNRLAKYVGQSGGKVISVVIPKREEIVIKIDGIKDAIFASRKY